MYCFPGAAPRPLVVGGHDRHASVGRIPRRSRARDASSDDRDSDHPVAIAQPESRRLVFKSLVESGGVTCYVDRLVMAMGWDETRSVRACSVSQTHHGLVRVLQLHIAFGQSHCSARLHKNNHRSDATKNCTHASLCCTEQDLLGRPCDQVKNAAAAKSQQKKRKKKTGQKDKLQAYMDSIQYLSLSSIQTRFFA